MWRVRGSRAARERAWESAFESRARRNPPPVLPTQDSGTQSIWSRQRQRGDGEFSTRATPILRATGVALSSQLGIVRRERSSCEPSGYCTSTAQILYSVLVLSDRADCDSDTRMFCMWRREKRRTS